MLRYIYIACRVRKQFYRQQTNFLILVSETVSLQAPTVVIFTQHPCRISAINTERYVNKQNQMTLKLQQTPGADKEYTANIQQDSWHASRRITC
jgi:hypothetical protein